MKSGCDTTAQCAHECNLNIINQMFKIVIKNKSTPYSCNPKQQKNNFHTSLKMHFNSFPRFLFFRIVLQFFFIPKSFMFLRCGGASVRCGDAPEIVWGCVPAPQKYFFCFARCRNHTIDVAKNIMDFIWFQYYLWNSEHPHSGRTLIVPFHIMLQCEHLLACMMSVIAVRCCYDAMDSHAAYLEPINIDTHAN